MRNLKKLCVACVLTLVLALPCFAGDMPGGVTAPPPPTQQATAQGEMPTGIAGDMGAGGRATDPTTNFFTSLLHGLLSLF